MAAVCVASPIRSIHDCTSTQPRIRRKWPTGLDKGVRLGHGGEDEEAGIWRSAQARYPMHTAIIQSRATRPPSRAQPDETYRRATALVADLLRSLRHTELILGSAPTSSLDDSRSEELIPTDSFAHAAVETPTSAPSSAAHRRSSFSPPLIASAMADYVDFGDNSGFQTRGKATKKAAKQSKWFDDDAGEDGLAGANGGDGDDGTTDKNGSAGGTGGTGGDGGGDDGDDWFGGGGKKNKKKNKKKQDDEDKKKQEEEEKKKKEEEDAAGISSLNWADDTNAANADDDWTAGFSNKKDKKKKGKKGAEDVPAAPDPPSIGFDDINLDDGATLGFDFGTGAKKSKEKDSGSGFGTWGNTWDFGAIGTAATTDKKTDKKSSTKDKDKDVGDPSLEFGDNNPWSSSNKSKTSTKKKTTISNGFDFGDFGAIDEANELDLDGDVGDVKASTDNAWGFSSVNKKDDKKKKSDKVKDDTADILSTEIENKDDGWSAWGAKTTKKKGKKGAEEEIPIPPPPPAVPVPDPPADEWSTFDFGKKDDKKKKSKKGLVDDPVQEKKDDLLVNGTDGAFDWGDIGSKKDKKGKKGLISEVNEDPIIAVGNMDDIKLGDGGGEDWMKSAWSSDKKKDKKPKKATADDSLGAFDLSPIADNKTTTSDPPADDMWAGFGTSKSKKDAKDKKSSKKSDVKVEEFPVPPPPDPPAPPEDDAWAAFGKKDKKSGKKSKVASPEPSIPDPDPKYEEEKDTFDTWTSSTKDKKKKDKEVKRKPVGGESGKEPEPEKAPEKDPLDDLLGDTWGYASKDKKKKEKDVDKKDSKKKSIYEPVIADLDDDPIPEVKEDNSWDTWGLASKDKKKKEKDTKKKVIDDPIPEEPKVKDKKEAAVEDDAWGALTTTKDKKTKKIKGKDDPPPPVPTPPAQGLTPEPGPLDLGDMDDFGGDTWAGLTTSKSKSSTKSAKVGLTKTTSTKGKTSKADDTKSTKSKDDDMFDLDMYGSSPIESKSAKKEADKDESAAKTVRSIWGSTGTSTTKSRLAKEKEEKAKKEADEKVRKEEEEAAAEAARQEEEEAALKKSKSKTSTKLSKTTSKTSDKVDEKKKKSAFDYDYPLDDLLDEPPAKDEKASSKLKKSSTKSSGLKDEETKEENPDYFSSIWGSSGATSKKTAGKKDGDAKKEINNKGWTNDKDPLGDLSNDLDFSIGDEKPSTSKPAKAMSSKTKTATASSSVAARIKAFEANKEDTGKKSKADSSLTKDLGTLEEPLAKTDKKDAASKTKATSASATKSSKKKDVSPVAEEKKSKESVPGSFPGGFGDDDILDFGGPSPPPKTSTKIVKDKKSSKTTKTTTKLAAMDDLDFLDEEPPKLPTPPPEDKKSSKKDRVKVERSGISRGLWGASAPPAKKSSKEKDSSKIQDEVDDSPPPVKKEKLPPGLSRSKSSRTTKEQGREDRKETEKKSKSSESDKDSSTKTKDTKSRPKATRGFSNFMFGGPPPSAMKTTRPSTRRSSTGGSKPSSRRASVDGLMSPPPDEDEPPMTDKAAKLMGLKPAKLERSKSLKNKGKSTVPDPYPIDDDDMVMINGFDDSPPAKSSKEASKLRPASKSKRDTKSQPKNLSQDDDAVMVDRAMGEPLVTSGPDDLAFVDHPPPLKRSNTTGAAKKAAGIFGSFFGAGVSVKERPKSYRADERETDQEDKESLPIRTKERIGKRRSTKTGDEAGFTTDAADQTADPDAEVRRADRKAKREAKDNAAREAEEADKAAREERRNARREREKADLEARRGKERERARKEQEAEDARREEKRARRADREKRKQEEEDAAAADAEKRREERRKARAEIEAENGPIDVDAVKEERRKRYDAEEEDRTRRRRDDRKSKDGKSSSKRKSTVLMDEYHEARSGGRSQAKNSPNIDNTKTSSWINSLADEPPDVPPISDTVFDPSGEKPRSAKEVNPRPEEEERKKRKDGKRSSRYVGAADLEYEDKRASRRREGRKTVDREPIKSASGRSGSGDAPPERDDDGAGTPSGRKDKGKKRDDYPDEYDPYRDEGVSKGFDAPSPPAVRPGVSRGESKRNSFFGKYF